MLYPSSSNFQIIITRESARNDNYTQSYVNNFQFVVENLKKDFIKKSKDNTASAYEINKAKLEENPNFLLAVYARYFFRISNLLILKLENSLS